MKRKLLVKLLSTYVLITVLCIVIMSSLFYVLFNDYYFDVKEQELLTQGNEMALILESQLRDKKIDQINEIVNVFNRVNKSHIWIVNKSGDVISGSEGLENDDGKCPESGQVQKALKGEYVTNRNDISHSKTPVLSVAMPMYIEDKVEGAVFICNPLSDIFGSIMQTLKMVMLAGLLAVLIVGFVSYVISRSITRPIIEITDISLDMAKGNFTKKTKVRSDDELGKLAETFNYMAEKLENSLISLKDEKDKMEKMERMQREFVANASHELRTPLTSIRGYIEAILDGVVKDRALQHRHLMTIHRETLRLNRLVNSLLDLSRLEAGQIEVKKNELDIAEIISRTAAKLRPLIEDHQIDLETHVPKEALSALGDEDLIEQVLINYITNAVRFTAEGGKITIKAEAVNHEVRVHVQDTGIGIAPEDIQKVWKRFYKINASRPLSKDGAGLGLSLVKEIMALLGGKAWVESKQGQGSVFSFSLAALKP